MLSPHVLVADLLETFPPMANLLLELRVDCLGCSMNKFCTLEELCGHYEMDINTLINAIQERIDRQPD